MAKASKESIEFQLRERLKELKCLYELSQIAWDAGHDVKKILAKTVGILPPAMQHPQLAEARIVVNKLEYATPGFKQTHYRISAPVISDGKKTGHAEIGYRAARAVNANKPFLAEEKKLLRTVSRELSLLLKRSIAEEEKQRLQLQLQHAERLAFVGELSAGIAHELNEPLGRILGFAQLIKKTGNLLEQQHEDVERIIKASLYTREIIKKLMFFSRQMPRQITPVNINDIISNILYFIDVRFQSNKIAMICRLDPALPHIQADAVQLSQVLVNLITNAIHAMPQGGELTVTTGTKDHGVRFTVKDTGLGMTREIRKKIFEPFFTTKPIGQGTGLGLSVVQGIVSAHHGKITVSSTPGKGSKFEVILPLRQPREK